MITKRSKVMCHIFIHKIMHNSITVSIKNKTGGGDKIIVSKGTLYFKYGPKENKTN